MILPAFSKTYEGRTVLDFSGMEVEPGTITAVIGANGSGKSTFARILAGVLPADRRIKPIEGIGYMPQKNYAFRMSLQKNLWLNNNKDIMLANWLMDALQIRHLSLKRADKLSGGETARMALARLMMKNYDLVILDEPTAPMDMESTLLSEALIQRYVKGSNCALILVTHSLQQARRIADHVWYFHRGRLLEVGSADMVLNHPQQPETRQFLDFYGI